MSIHGPDADRQKIGQHLGTLPRIPNERPLLARKMTSTRATARHAIPRIVGIIADVQMARVHAIGPVALVKNMKAVRDRPVEMRIHDTMAKNHPPSIPHPRVTPGTRSPQAKPARRQIVGRLNSGPQDLANKRRMDGEDRKIREQHHDKASERIGQSR